MRNRTLTLAVVGLAVVALLGGAALVSADDGDDRGGVVDRWHDGVDTADWMDGHHADHDPGEHHDGDHHDGEHTHGEYHVDHDHGAHR